MSKSLYNTQMWPRFPTAFSISSHTQAGITHAAFTNLKTTTRTQALPTPASRPQLAHRHYPHQPQNHNSHTGTTHTNLKTTTRTQALPTPTSKPQLAHRHYPHQPQNHNSHTLPTPTSKPQLAHRHYPHQPQNHNYHTSISHAVHTSPKTTAGTQTLPTPSTPAPNPQLAYRHFPRLPY
ncbi:hypothetical protein HNY73_002483 [Argiope bruennichi]|uniref:Uncharacterized protein n=1 Tax=Argiope bruennichi TaxID=94029 RepID=A0A8T0FWD1_ARGBR|nr:hypothetical protein HNY73_002483 [Argiope bruennichi]